MCVSHIYAFTVCTKRSKCTCTAQAVATRLSVSSSKAVECPLMRDDCGTEVQETAGTRETGL